MDDKPKTPRPRLTDKETYWPPCLCGHKATSHGMNNGKTADTRLASRGGRYPCKCKGCPCFGYRNAT